MSRDDVHPRFSLDDLLWLIEEMPTAASTFDELKDDLVAREIPVSDRDLLRLLRRGIREDLVADWHARGAVRFTLTPRSADRLGVHLASPPDGGSVMGAIDDPDVAREGTGIDDAFWVNKELAFVERIKPTPYEDRVPRDLDALADPRLPEPLDVLANSGGSGEQLKDGSRVKPGLILGIGLQWPQALAPAEVAGRYVCRGCKQDLVTDRPRLKRDAYCTICDRSGVDGRFHPIEPDLLQDGRKKYTPAAPPLRGHRAKKSPPSRDRAHVA